MCLGPSLLGTHRLAVSSSSLFCYLPISPIFSVRGLTFVKEREIAGDKMNSVEKPSFENILKTHIFPNYVFFDQIWNRLATFSGVSAVFLWVFTSCFWRMNHPHLLQVGSYLTQATPASAGSKIKLAPLLGLFPKCVSVKRLSEHQRFCPAADLLPHNPHLHSSLPSCLNGRALALFPQRTPLGLQASPSLAS